MRPSSVLYEVNRASREERSRVRPGDFVEHVEPHYAGLVQRLTLVLHDADDARDVAQEAYLRAWKAWDRFEGDNPRAWLHTIGLRLAFNHRRGRARLRSFLERSPRAEPAWVPELRVDLWRALRRINRRERAALLMNAVDGFTQQEISELLDVPSGTVAGWIARAKQALRDELHGGDLKL
jgi:RNA polymerase sigma-70 factor, ECF subfamily